MKRALSNLAITLVIVVVLGGVILLATFLPGEAIRKFFMNNWIGFAIGVVLSHLVMLLRAKKLRKEDEEDDDE